jgi:antitoxin (DNA-binding transcriptional repressor) of toxin-antitoxin stability system
VTAVQTLTSRDVQKNFGPVADMVATGQGVRVTKYGRPAFLIIPESEDSDEILRRVAGRRLTGMLKGGVATPAARALSPDDVRQLIDTCFA